MRCAYTTSLLPTDRDLQRFRAAIASTLRRQRNSEAVRWAEGLVKRDVFGYCATTSLRLDLMAERVLGELRAADVSLLDVLQRVGEVVALRADGDHVLSENPKAFRCCLARFVLRLRPDVRGVRRPRLEAPQLYYVGTLIDELLTRFALAVLEQVKRSQVETRSFRGACDELASGAPKYIRPPRHGRTHSHRTHKGKPL